MEPQTKDPLLSSLDSYIFYGRLDRFEAYPSSEHKGRWDFIENKLRSFTSITDIHDELLRAFYYSAYMKDYNTFYNERWHHLFYWMGYKVLNSLKSNTSEFPDIMYLFKNVRDMLDNTKTHSDIIIEISSNEFPTLKKVYDYVQNYGTINNKLSTHGFKCTQEFNQYIETGYAAYDTFRKGCISNGESCKFFNLIFDTVEKKQLKGLKCREIKDASFFRVLNEEDEDEESRRSLTKLGGPLDASQGHMSTMASSHLGLSAHDSSAASYNSTSSISMGILLPLFGSLFIFFVLYKFTPLGSWIHARFIKKKIGFNEQEVIDENDFLLDDKYENININTLSATHKVGYNPYEIS
ncbi:PIR protein [Plasmodium ovale]|uniref:PIR protein n=1 Tax=Plasmodium ovale TaxID=36330 RepID=A0A1C3KFC6_PLAOA|nr:PIR protein [Plasmodium ovale]